MFKGFPDQKTVRRLRDLYPTGTRVVLEKMNDPYTSLRPGDAGRVVHVDDAGSIHVQWDKGSSLAVVCDVDIIRLE